MSYLENCLNSVMDQDYPRHRYEIIVADNGSTDNSVSFLESKYEKDITLVKFGINNGFAKGNNLAVKYAKGDLLVFLNQDTIVHNQWLSALVKGIHDNNYDVCHSNMLFPRNAEFEKAYKREFPENIYEEKLISLIKKLNNDKKVHAIMVELPLPKFMDEKKVLKAISPEKDVDGLNPVNVGNLLVGDETIAPCTPKGIMRMLEKMKIKVVKKDVVIVNNSNVVGKPLAMMLTNRFATVTICHVKTRYLGRFTKKAEIIITATGVPNLIKQDMVKEGVVIIDAGINCKGDRVCGDVDFENVKELTSFITPVPGGVGPMTVAMVLENTLTLAKNQK